MCGPMNEPDDRQRRDTGYHYPNPGWCMTASEEMASYAERGIPVPDELRHEAAKEQGW